jgi:serine/threonine-protein kinase RsbW
MKMRVMFSLPRQPESISVARQLVDRIFVAFGVHADCRREIALAVSEACANAVSHAASVSAYEISAKTEDSECVITVDDDGPGVSPLPPADMPAADAIDGRGFAIIRLMTDRMDVRRRPRGGLSVRMFKRLRWIDSAIGRTS